MHKKKGTFPNTHVCKYAHKQMQAGYKRSYITHLKGKAELSSNQFHWKWASVQS